MIKYKVVVATNLGALMENVNYFLATGFKLQGGISVGANSLYYQAMVKE